MAELVKRVDETTQVFTAILVLGLVGLLFLIVFGNLSGNLGFADQSTTRVNESSGYSINGTTFTLDGRSSANFVSLTLTTVHNNSDAVVIQSGNYTFDSIAGTIVGTVGRSDNYTNVNITYSVTNRSEAGADTDQVIGNLTGGAVTFFSFSNVWFTLLAVVLLIIIVMSVIGVVSKRKSTGFAS